MSGDAHDDVDVAVVGAGISGLRLATLLTDQGRSVRVLEARGRVGGRLHSVDAGGGRLDLGASWFWPGEQRVAALVDESGVRVHTQHIAGDALYHAPGGVQRLDGNPIDVPALRFSDGAQTLAERLHERLPWHVVSLDDPVESIDLAGPTAGVVEHRSGATTARQVVLALPPALAIERIEIAPALPDELASLAAATPVWMGAMTKVVAVYPEPFWRARGLAGAAISHLGPLRELHDMSGPGGAPAALFGFAPGRPGVATISAEAVTSQLAEVFGPEAGRPTELHIADWRQDATSPSGVENRADYGLFGHPLYQRPWFDGRLHWCSTETATSAPGHIEGALDAAERTFHELHV